MSVKVGSVMDKQDLKNSDTPPRWERRRDERPREILEAAMSLFVEKGFSSTRLDDVAERAGISKGTLYLYFNDKEDIFKQVLISAAVPKMEMVESMIKNHTGAIEGLVKNITSILGDVVISTPLGALPKLVISEAGNFPHLAEFHRDNVLKRLQDIFASVVKLGIKKGEFKKRPPLEAARSLMSSIFLCAVCIHMPGFTEHLQLDPRKQIDVSTEIWLEGMRI
jgi:AcrR family transcriptional regulator